LCPFQVVIIIFIVDFLGLENEKVVGSLAGLRNASKHIESGVVSGDRVVVDAGHVEYVEVKLL
jgi:hypothetical protein